MAMKEMEMGEPNDTQPILRSSSDGETVSKKTHRLIVFSVMVIVVLPLFIVTIVFATRDYKDNETLYVYEEDDDAWKQQFKVESTSGAVATDDGRCSEIAASILDQGGRAMDAAIAATLCLGVVGPSSSGLGGGCFVLSRNASGDVLFLDSREEAPLAATKDMYASDPSASAWGGLAVAVPSELRGLYQAYQLQGGGVGWADLVAPSVALAEEYVISEHMGEHIAVISPIIEADKALYKDIHGLLTRGDGSYKTGGDLIHNSALAETLRQVALDPEYLHTTMAATLAEEIQAAGGIVTAAEISAYSPKVRDAVRHTLLGHELISSPPPSSGGLIVVALLQFMAGLSEPMASQDEVYYHYLAEAMKHGFAMRMSLGDPDFVNVTQVEQDILHNDYVSTLVATLRETDVLNLTEYGGADYGVMEDDLLRSLPEDHGTSHLSVVDRWGSAVGITSTVNYYFGSLVMSPSTGIIFNDQMDDFSKPNSTNVFGLHPFESNYIEPGKRPLSSMSPTIAVRESNGRVRLVGGASGGPRIITSTAQVLLNFLGRGMSLLDSVVTGRIHTQLLPEVVGVENQTVACAPDVCEGEESEGVDLQFRAGEDVQQALSSRHHDVSVNERAGFAVTQFIEVEVEQNSEQQQHHLIAVSDPRKGGKPAASNADF